MRERLEPIPLWRVFMAFGVLFASLAAASALPDQLDFSIGWTGALVSSWLLRWPRP